MSESLFHRTFRRTRMPLSDGHMDVCLSPDASPETIAALRELGEAALARMARNEWVRDHFGPEARVSGDCACGRQMEAEEYGYNGGSHGVYKCANCGTEWVVDLNGAMWPKPECWINGARFAHHGVKPHMTGAQIRALPVPSIRDSDDLFVQVADGEDLLVAYDETVPVAGRRFFTVPRFINAG